jgi:hypothetical protein
MSSDLDAKVARILDGTIATLRYEVAGNRLRSNYTDQRQLTSACQLDVAVEPPHPQKMDDRTSAGYDLQVLMLQKWTRRSRRVLSRGDALARSGAGGVFGAVTGTDAVLRQSTGPAPTIAERDVGNSRTPAVSSG